MQTESRLQEDCYVWLHNTYPHLRGLFFEIGNNAFSAQSGMMHKAMGRVAGVADTCLLLPTGQAVFIEFKTATGKQSEVQQKWQQKIESAGYKYHIVRSLEGFKYLIECILA